MGADATVTSARTNRLETLYSEHIHRAVRLAFLVTGDEQQAQDIAQEAFVRIAGRFHDLRNPDAFPGYLRATVLNLSRGHLRRLRTQREYLRRRSEREAVALHPDSESRDEMWQALERLPYRQRAALVLRYYEDLSERQAADALDCSVSAMKSLVTRGLQALRAEMEGGRG
ncbi:MAG TPA: sigma-70 family RNA polymerase sigma factor [Actinomycetota bacterium]|nr:sigma-70 family RNA polymerase sigma factor [Actinomycetota bacterium]